MNSPAMELGQIPMTPALTAAMARASEVATASGAGEITLEHLLYALCDDPDAIAVLSASRVDVEHLRNETAAYVTGGRAVAMPVYGGLAPSEDVARILEAAAAAARGGRRRDVNGAIVIAAIVGDGRSFAAHLLHGCGLTFDEAIRALQRAFSSLPIHDTQTIVPAADDILARARERVQSRAAPSLRDMMGDGGRAAPLYVPVSTQEPSHRVEAEIRTGRDAPVAAPAIEPVEVLSAEVGDAAASAPSAPVSVDLEAYPDATLSDAIAAPTPSAPILTGDAEVLSPPESSAPTAAPASDDKLSTEIAPRPQRSVTSDSAVLASPSTMDDVLASIRSPYSTARPPHHPSVEALDGPPASKYPPLDQAGPIKRSAVPRAAFDFDIPRPAPVKPPPIPNSPYANAASGSPTSPHAPWPELDPIASNADRGAMLRPAGEPTFGATPQANTSRSPNLGRSAGSFLQTGAPKGPAAPALLAPAAAAPPPASQRGEAASAVEAGQLAENIPRSMRVGVTERVEIRIAKASVKTIVEGLEGGGAAWRHDVVITKAMSIRLRAPDGGFFIETASPETQWIENQLGFGADDFASWRFLITPQFRGYAQLQIIVSARTVGADGVAAETGMPDQVVEVKVRSNYRRAFATGVGWIAAAIVGGALARFGEAGLDAAHPLVTKFFN
ncbi:MAG: Clp protease N-terminal domain-containing protein [Hyphomicrobium sp.]